MSTNLEFQLDSIDTTLEQNFTLPNNTTIEQFSIKLHIVNDPTGTFTLTLKDGVTIIEAMSLTVAQINALILVQEGFTEVNKNGYILFEPVFPINLRRNVEYTLLLSSSGYTFSSSSSIAWVVEYLNEMNKLLDVPASDLGKALSYKLHGYTEYGGFVMPRVATIFDGQQSATAPSLGSLTRTVTGSEGTPIVITAGGGISIADVPVEMIFIESNGGAIDITANPQIEAGSVVGQELNLTGTAVNTIQLDDGNGLSMDGSRILDGETNITLLWTGTVWKLER